MEEEAEALAEAEAALENQEEAMAEPAEPVEPEEQVEAAAGLSCFWRINRFQLAVWLTQEEAKELLQVREATDQLEKKLQKDSTVERADHSHPVADTKANILVNTTTLQAAEAEVREARAYTEPVGQEAE